MTRSEKITLFVGLGAVILSVVLNIGVREWYAPDIRYEEGSYYISGKTAIISLKLTNSGHSDAEDIIIDSSFNRPIMDISTDDQSINLWIISGGKETNYVSCKIDRLVPGQELYIFYAVNYEKMTLPELNKHFISKITFNGGKGKTGNPSKFIAGMFVTIGILITIIAIILTGKTAYYEGKTAYEEKLVSHEKFIKNIYDITMLIYKAKLDNISKEFIIAQTDNYINKLPRDKKYKQNMREYASSVIDLSDNDTD